MLSTPFTAGTLNSVVSASAYNFAVTTPVPPGATVTVFAGASGSTTATAVSDSQGNLYTLAASSTANEWLQAFTATATAGLNPLASDQWTVTYSAANTQAKLAIAVAVTGASGTDIAVAANGSSTSASASGTAAAGNELALACWQSAFTPGPGAGWTTLTSLSSGLSEAVGYQFLPNAGPVTAAATVTSGPWAAVLLTLKAAAPVALGNGTAPSGGPQLPPYPVLPSPRAWSSADKILTPYLRNDPGNAISLLTAPPVYVGGQTVTAQGLTSGIVTPLQMDTDLLDAWASHQQPSAAVTPSLAGWYLAEGFANIAALPTTTTVAAGIQAVQGGVTAQCDGAKQSTNGVLSPFPDVCDLVQVNPASSDSISLYALQDSGSTVHLTSAYLKTEWVAGSTGVTLNPPYPAAGWTPGKTSLLAGCSAGATSVLVSDPTGIFGGGKIQLDSGNAAADTVTVVSVSGQTIGISACAYAHSAAAPVAVPIAATWMNQQVRDKIRFLAYRPFARLTNQTGSQANLPAQTWPAGTAVQWSSPYLPGLRGADNYTAWSSGNPTQYVFPVSGTYYLYGQVYITDAASSLFLSAGLAVSGGTVLWGNRVTSAGSTSEGVCATVRRTLRVTAGQYAEVYASQSSAGSLAWKTTAQSCSRFIAVWRGF